MPELPTATLHSDAEIDFWCYLPGLPTFRLRMMRDDRYIERLLRMEQIFWEDFQKMSQVTS
jgi:hypothetical protein